MDKICLGSATRLGMNLFYLTNVADKTFNTYLQVPVGRGSSLKQTLQTERDFLKSLKFSSEILTEIEELIKRIDDSKKESYNDLPQNEQRFFKETISSLVPQIRKEMASYEAYYPSTLSLLNKSNLILGASSFFKSKSWEKIPSVCKQDLDDACRCLFFELPTPAGILALRATEGVLRKYYSKQISLSATSPLNWGKIIQTLKTKPHIDLALMGHLDYLRKNLRNKLSHPEMRLSQKEAENLFSMIVVTIETIL